MLSAPGADLRQRGSLNNHWGVPLSLARMPRDARYGVFELGMNHPGEIGPLARQVAAACRADHRRSSRSHLGSSARSRRSPTPRPRSSRAWSRAAPCRAQPRQPAFRPAGRHAARTAALSRIVGFGAARRRRRAADRLPRSHATGSDVGAVIDGKPHRLSRSALPGEHWVHEQPGRAAGGREALGARRRDGGAGAGERRAARRAAARGERIAARRRHADADRRELQRQPGLDARGACRCWASEPAAAAAGIAVLGDMLELGERRRRCMPRWPSRSQAAGVDLVFTAAART